MTPTNGVFAEKATPVVTRLAPSVSVIVGSLVTALPFVATFGFLPPFGLLVFLTWRLLRPDVFRVWAPLGFGFFDDLVSGQPLGSAMLLWTLSFIVLDLLDRRLVYRDFWQDWLLAGGAVALCLIGGRLIATRFDAHVDTVLLFQIAISILFYPPAAMIVARLARRSAPD
ncbi:rod shape-determining protein MreD [uncultured Sphingomonas sp.]|uniref:rod shape-determining protein MreD n=1 Tax=uncultured Sphingomonas sp. TaxID=158754 RepID=UPI0035CACB99